MGTGGFNFEEEKLAVAVEPVVIVNRCKYADVEEASFEILIAAL